MRRCRRRTERPRSIQIRKPPARRPPRLNLARRIASPIRFPFKRFHVLFNSLFKVLFIFPSRYLFAIGLVPIFSFRWSLPPILGCIPKQPDSSKTHRERPVPPQTGLSPSMTCCSKQLGRPRVRLESASRNYNSASQATQISNLSCSRFIRHY